MKSLRQISRRDAVRLLAIGGTVPFVGGCILPAAPMAAGSGRLNARPGVPVTTMPHGTSEHPIGQSSCVIHVPDTVDRNTAVGLLLFLHGANRTVDAFVEAHRPMLDANDVIMVAPYAADGGTWDLVMGLGFLVDHGVVDVSLDTVYRSWTIDPARIVISGFSDGATYSLALGRANGDLWKQIVAYSPGGLLEVDTIGKPPVLITHGTQDGVLPVGTSRDIIVPALRARGYSVDYREFEGPHAVLGSAALEVVQSIGRK